MARRYLMPHNYHLILHFWWMHQILNLDVMDISVGRSNTIIGGRPEVSFHDPHLPMPSLSSAKSLHSSLAFLEVTPQDSVCLCTCSYHRAQRQKKGRGFASSSCTTCSKHVAGLDVRSGGNGCAPLGWMGKGAWTARSLSAILTIALFPSSPTLRTRQGRVSCSRLTAAAVAIGGTCSTSDAAGDGHQLLWSVQGCHWEEPSKDCNNSQCP